MFVTRICKALVPRHEELDNLMRVYGCATRYAFNRLLEGEDSKDLIQLIPPKFQLKTVRLLQGQYVLQTL